MTREQAVHALAMDIKVHARLCGLRRLAVETTRTYRDLIAHGVPVDVVRGYFAVRMLSERLDEERRDERFG